MPLSSNMILPTADLLGQLWKKKQNKLTKKITQGVGKGEPTAARHADLHGGQII